MSASPRSYHGSPSPGTLPSATIHDLRFLYTEHLLLESRHHREIEEEQRQAGVNPLDARLRRGAIDAELERRRHLYRRNPDMPAWPRMDDERYQQLLEDARALKAIWPLTAFLERIVGMQLQGRGDELRGRCIFPDHGPNSKSGASFTVSRSKDVWHCKGCGRGGDLYKLVGEYFDIIAFPDQVRKVEEITGTMVESARIILANDEAVRRDSDEVLR